MKRRTGVVVGVLAALVAVIVWFARGRGDGDGGGNTDHGGTTAAKVTSGTQAPAGRGARVDPRTQPRGRISGVVRDDARAPIAGATVCAGAWSWDLPSEDTREPRCVTTGADGRYTIDGLYAATYSVYASARGYLPAEYHPKGDRHDTTFRLAAGQHEDGVDFALRKGGVEITGTVSDISGGPIAHAKVAAQGGRWGQGVSSPPVEADDRGAFSIWVAAGDVRVTASADGYAPDDQMGRAPGEFELRLTPEASLAGIVVDARTGAPIEGARVTVGEGRWGGGDSERTGADGKFRVARLTPGRYVATARTDHGYGRTEGSVLVGLGEHVDGVVVKLHPAARVTGKVVILPDKQVCTDGGVSLRDDAHDRWVGARTEDDGTVIAEGVLPGTYTPRVWCPGYQEIEKYAPIVVANEDVTDLVWEVEAGATVRGRVLTRSGTPVEGAQVNGRITGGAARAKDDWTHDVSLADGSYELRGLRAATYRLDVDAEAGVQPTDGYKVDAVPGQTVTRDLVLEDGGAIAGTIVDDKGAPVAKVDVSAWPFAEGTRWWGNDTIKSDARGAFRIDGLRGGDYRVVARRGWSDVLRKPGETDDAKHGEKVTVKVGEVATVKLVVAAPTGTIKGVVVDAEGKPVPDAFLSAARESDAAGADGNSAHGTRGWGWGDSDKPVLTATDGTFTIDRLSPGSYTVRAYRKGGGEAIAEHVRVGSTARLQIKPTGLIAGTVTVAGSAPPDEITVEVADLKTGYHRHEVFFRTSGAFEIADLPAGHFHVSVTADAGRAKQELDLAEGQTRRDVAFTLEALLTLTGRVVELGTTKPVAGFRMSASPAQGNSFSFSWGDDERDNITDESGRFTIKRAPRGRLQILGMHKDFNESDYGWLRVLRAVDGSGTVDLGDIGVLKKRLKDGEVAGGLGCHFKEQPPDTPPEQHRLEISFLEPGGAAQKAGIEVGDVITTVDGIDVTSGNAMHAWTLMQAPPGTKLTLGLQRGATVTVTLAAPT